MPNELTKPEKKIARELIDKGLQIEYEKAIRDMDAIITDWKNKESTNKQAYLALYKKLDEHDNHIGDRYNALGGSRYLDMVGILLVDGLITEADIEGFSEESKAYLHRFVNLLGNS